jgi:trans-aconitate methyltransferase
MIPRPESFGEQFAARFEDQSVVDRYHLRATYPPEMFTFLNALIVDEPRVVLDVGCGTGNIARPLASYVDRVDAVDRSAPMLARARTLPGGDSPKIRWLQGRTEDIETDPPYALITAGESLHWMDWSAVLPRFAQECTPNGVLAVLYLEEESVPWHEGYVEIVRRYSTNRTYVPFDWIAELEKYYLFQKLGEHRATPLPIRQTVADYVAAQHARSSLSLEAMSSEQATQFDAELRALLEPFVRDGMLSFDVVGGLTWGKPKSGES